MIGLGSNRVLAVIERTRAAIAAGQRVDGKGHIDPAALPALEAAMALDTLEHFAFQNAQARAHAMGRLTLDEAMTIYAALGEVGSADNGGWAEGTDLAAKVVITQVMKEIVGR